MKLALSEPMAEYLSSVFLPTFHVYEWEKSALTPWFVEHSLSVTIAPDITGDITYDFIHINRDPSYDYRRVCQSAPHIRTYGWLLLTLPLSYRAWLYLEPVLFNWTCIFIVPLNNEFSTHSEVLFRKPKEGA